MNRIISIQFLLISIFSIGITIFFSSGILLSHQFAVGNKKGFQESKKIYIPLADFIKIEKLKLSDDIFEIEYQGQEYDVYKQEVINSIIVLWVVKDSFENKIRELNRIVFGHEGFTKSIKSNLFLMFNFYFFIETDNSMLKNNYSCFVSFFNYNLRKYSAFIKINLLPPIN